MLANLVREQIRKLLGRKETDLGKLEWKSE